MNTKPIVAILALLFAATASPIAHGSIILIQDDFGSGSVSKTTDGFRLRENSVDQSWQAARQGGGSAWTISGGTLQNASTVNTPGYPNYIPGEGPVGQSISLSGAGLTGVETRLILQFDYTVPASDTLQVTLWGHTGTFDPGSSNIFANLETRVGLGNSEGTSTLDAFNLLDGASTGFGGTTNPLASFPGSASGTFRTAIDLPSLGIPGVSTVSDLTVITLGIGKFEDGTAGTTSIDNLSLIATTVPEPSSALLLGAILSAWTGLHRRRRRNLTSSQQG